MERGADGADFERSEGRRGERDSTTEVIFQLHADSWRKEQEPFCDTVKREVNL